MRTDKHFLQAYRQLSPNPQSLRRDQCREAALVDLTLHFLSEHFPGEPVGVIPFLLSGYAQIAGAASPGMRQALHNLRQYCASFASAYGWRTAVEAHADVPEMNRAYRVEAGEHA